MLCASVPPAWAADLPAFADDERVVVIDAESSLVSAMMNADSAWFICAAAYAANGTFSSGRYALSAMMSARYASC